MLVDYVGTKDPDYPTRLAHRVGALLEAGAKPSPNAKMVELARKHFDYDILAQRAGAVLDAMTS